MNAMRTLTALLASAALLSCAEKQQQTAQPKMEQMKIANISQFDLATCWPKARTLPEPANRESVVGFLVAQRPAVLECLVDPKNRGPDKTTRVAVDTTVGETVENKISGDNLTPAGIACVKGVLDKAVGLKPQPKGAAPASGHAEFVHNTGLNPTVTFGVNEPSDAVGMIRLAEQSWCDCFADWKEAAPYKLFAKLELSKAAAAGAADAGPGAPPSVQVTFDPATNPAADKVAACLKDKMAALPYATKAEKLKFAYPFITLNTNVPDDLPDAVDDVKLFQLDGVRTQRQAEVALAYSAVTNKAEGWNALVTKYKKSPASVPVKELKSKCAELLKADDSWVASLDSQLGVEKRLADLATKAKDANPNDQGWSDTLTGVQANMKQTEDQLGAVKKARAGDAAGCPKEHF